MNRMTHTSILSSEVVPPAGHYSQAVVAQGQVFISGQLPVSAEGHHHPDAPLDIQVDRVMANVFAILRAAGGTPENIARVTVYVAGVEHWPAFNVRYAEIMGPLKPARTVVPVPALHHGYLVEVDAIAILKS